MFIGGFEGFIDGPDGREAAAGGGRAESFSKDLARILEDSINDIGGTKD